jgi:hypothetical protein
MRNNLNDPPRGDLNTRNSAGGMMLAAIVAAIVLLGLFMWAPWNDNSRSATTNTGTTVGSSTARPGAPTTPTSPTTPASPTNR